MSAPVFPDADIATLLRRQAALHPQRSALRSDDGQSVSYAELFKRVSETAAGLAACFPRADRARPRLALVLPNGAALATTLLAATFAGIALPFNPAYRRDEFERYFRETRIDGLIVGEGETGPACAVAAELGLPIMRCTADGTIPIETTSGIIAGPAPSPGDVALVLLTSGSTGRSKSVPLTHLNVCTSAADVCRSVELSSDDRCLSMWEQYHVGGLVDLLLAPLSVGSTIICTPGFDAGRFFQLLHEFRPTWFQGVPTTLNELILHADRNPVVARPSSLRFIRSVAAALPPRVMAELEERFGVPVIQTFGMTEAGPLITSTRLPPARRKPGSTGSTCGCEVAIFDPDGSRLAPEDAGEVAIRGPNVFAGYENDEEANRAQFRSGWFFTGDTGYVDREGDLFLTGRIKQLINRGGEKINPQEVEEALLAHPAVHEAAVFAVRHRTLGEDVAAAISLRTVADVGEIRRFAATRLAAFKVPRQIDVVPALARNAVGKIDKLLLAEAAEARSHVAAAPVKPGNALEGFLVGLWAAELDVETVGVDDDFAALGGDSLASLRIVLATESAFGISIPAEATVGFDTVRAMAAYLAALGCRVASGGAAGEGRNKDPVSPQHLLRDLDDDLSDAEQDIDIAARRLAACGTREEFNRLVDLILLYFTPAELLELPRRMRDARRLAPNTAYPSALRRLRLVFRRWEWTLRLRRELGAARRDAGLWRRHLASTDAFLYSAEAKDPELKTLVVGFAGNWMRLMMPVYRILSCLDPNRFDLLLLRDRSRRGFVDGIPGLGESLPALGHFLSDYVASHHYAKAICFGTSSGGLAAVFVASSNHWRRAVAIGADIPERHPIMIQHLHRTATTDGSAGVELDLCYAATNERDREAARQLREMFPASRDLPDHRWREHNLLHQLYRAGELAAFLDQRFRP